MIKMKEIKSKSVDTWHTGDIGGLQLTDITVHFN